MSCSRIYNDYDGVQHDYTRKQGLVWQQVVLPDMAPAEWTNREVLWNAVEKAEKTKDSRLAREFVVALPVELGRDEWIALLTDFIQINFVAEGMCADVCIHDTDGHNPHAHIMLTVRPLTKDGKWQHKTEKEYLCVRNGEEWGFTAAGSSLRSPRDGKSSINTKSARKWCIWHLPRLRYKGWTEYPSIRKAPSTGGRILSPPAGTARNSLFSSGRHGLI